MPHNMIIGSREIGISELTPEEIEINKERLSNFAGYTFDSNPYGLVRVSYHDKLRYIQRAGESYITRCLKIKNEDYWWIKALGRNTLEGLNLKESADGLYITDYCKGLRQVREDGYLMGWGNGTTSKERGEMRSTKSMAHWRGRNRVAVVRVGNPQ